VVEKNSVTIEDYLELIFVLQRDNQPVVGARLADILKVTPPTVTNTLKRMTRDGLLAFNDQRGTFLTEQGMETARKVMRRHMLSEWMLMRMLKIPWSRTHAEAHNFEHAISEEIEKQMTMNLGDPKTCPHGNPLPGYEEATRSWLPLNQIGVGETVVVRRIHEMGESLPDLLNFLEENGIIPGKTIQITEILPFNQTISLKVGSRSVSIGFSTAGYIHVEKLS
jgi:DtxR family Mn-dependent transcriptional regulator